MNDEAAIDLNFQASQDSHLIFFWLFEWPPLLQASKNLIYILNFNPYFVLYDWCSRSKTEEIASSLWLELWRKFPTTRRLPHKPSGPCDHLRREVPSWGKVWSFKQCQINGTVYYSKSYKVIARNNFTVNFSGKKRSENGFVLNYVKFRGSVNRHLVEIRTVTANWH